MQFAFILKVLLINPHLAYLRTWNVLQLFTYNLASSELTPFLYGNDFLNKYCINV